MCLSVDRPSLNFTTISFCPKAPLIELLGGSSPAAQEGADCTAASPDVSSQGVTELGRLWGHKNHSSPRVLRCLPVILGNERWWDNDLPEASAVSCCTGERSTRLSGFQGAKGMEHPLRENQQIAQRHSPNRLS